MIDKIFDNNFESHDYDKCSNSKFSVEDSSITFDEKLDIDLIYDNIIKLILKNDEFTNFTILDEDGNIDKLIKDKICEVYSYVISNLKKCSKIEVFSILTDYYNVNPSKFYDALTNNFKIELINELKQRGYIIKKNSLF